MAKVLICRDIYNGRFVAAKKPIRASEHFSKEARLWLGLGHHPNIVRAHTVHKVEGTPYLFMDFVGDSKGNSRNIRHEFSNLNKENSLDLFLNIGISVLRALKYAQSVFPGFVHRDLKPENILIDGKSNILVSDFGIGHIPKYDYTGSSNARGSCVSNMMISPDTAITRYGSFAGTVGYAAPEQYVDSSTVTFKADIYSLGVILYEAIAGVMPVDPRQIQETGLKVLESPPRRLLSILPRELDDIVMKMLQFFPEERPKTLDEIAECFRKFRPNTPDFQHNQSVINENASGLDNTTLSNRIYSLMQLNEIQLAATSAIEFQRRHPWHFESPTLIRTLFAIMGERKQGWTFLKKAIRSDLLNPKKCIPGLAASVLLSVPMVSACISQRTSSTTHWFLKSYLSTPEAIIGLLLLSVLFAESYINSRTSLTLDRITLPGILAGIVSSFLLNAMGYPVLAGSGLQSMTAAFLCGGILYILAVLSKGGVGGGTIKLGAMIGSFTGFMIIPITLLTFIIMVIRGILIKLLTSSRDELKWVHNRLSPGFLSKYSFKQVPTSSSFIFATWIVISWPGFKTLF